MRSLSDRGGSLLATLSEEVATLTESVVQSTAIVTGQTRDFAQSSGSAWLYDQEHLVTNNHVVVELVEPIWIRFPDSADTRASVVGRDPLTDLALLHVDAPSRRPLPLRARPARLGEFCFALGSPLGEYPESMSFGVVSGLRRSLPASAGRFIYDVIQTDCAINPGNSGGPLVSTEGSVLGVNTAIRSGAQGMGFAVPAETVQDIIPELLAHGHIERASLGVNVAPRPYEAEVGSHRLVITAVRSTATGPFEKDDVILSVGGHEVRNQHDLIKVLRRNMVERTVPVSLARKKERLSIECIPSRLPPT